MGKIVFRPVRHQGVDIVAADPPRHVGEPVCDLVGLCFSEPEKVAKQAGIGPGLVQSGQVAGNRAEVQRASVGENGVERQDIVAHCTVSQ